MIQLLSAQSLSTLFGGTRYYYVDGATLSDATITEREMMVAEAGVFRDSYFTVAAAPAAGKSFIFTLMQNGVATAHVVTIAETATSGSDSSNPISVAAGDRLVWRFTQTGSPTIQNFRSVSEWESTAVKRAVWGTAIFCGGGSGPSNSVASYSVIGACADAGSAGSSTTQGLRSVVWAIDATIKNFYVKVAAAPGAGKSWTYRIVKNSVEEASSEIIINETNTAASITGLSIDVAPGDLLEIKFLPAGTPTQANIAWGISYEPDVDGRWNVSSKIETVGSNFMAIKHVWLIGESATEADMTGLAVGTSNPNISVLGARMQITTAPGAGKSRSYTLNKNGSATAVVVTVSNTDTTGSITGTNVVYNKEDTWVLDGSTSGTPAGGGAGSVALLLSQAGGAATPGGGGGRGGGKPPGGGGGSGGLIGPVLKKLRFPEKVI